MTLRCFDSSSIKQLNRSSLLGALVSFAFGTALYAEEPVVKKEDPFSGIASVSLRSSTESKREADYRIFLRGAINLQYVYSEWVTFGFSARGDKDLNNEYHASFLDTVFSASHSATLAEGLTSGVDVYYSAPGDKDQYRYSNSKGTLGASGSLNYDFAGVLSGLSIKGGLGYERYLYSYTDSDGGSVLDKWSLSQTAGLSYTYKAATFSTVFTNYSIWDFNGNKQDDSFLSVQSFKYQVNTDWAASFGYINDGSTFDYGGASNNIKLYDARRSQVFVATSYKF